MRTFVLAALLARVVLCNAAESPEETALKRYGLQPPPEPAPKTNLILVGATSPYSLRDLYIELACKDPYRKIGEKLYDLTDRCAYARRDRYADGKLVVSEKPLQEFEMIHGTVFQVVPDGLLFRRYEETDWEAKGEYEVVFVRNHPWEGAVVDNNPLAFYALRSGRFIYTTTLGSSKAIPAFDHGTKPSQSEIERLKKEHSDKRAQIEFEMGAKEVAAREAAFAAESKRKQKINEGLVRFLKEKAEAGSGRFQFELAEHYLKGDGVETNTALAKFWLQCACTNQVPGAAELLSKINPKR